MRSFHIEVHFKTDVKLEMYRAAYDEAIKLATITLEELWHTKGKTATTLMRPWYDIVYRITE